jgi:hypothetical protein
MAKSVKKRWCPRCRKSHAVARLRIVCKRRGDKSAKKAGQAIGRWMRKFEAKKGVPSVKDTVRYVTLFSLLCSAKGKGKKKRSSRKVKRLNPMEKVMHKGKPYTFRELITKHGLRKAAPLFSKLIMKKYPAMRQYMRHPMASN